MSTVEIDPQFLPYLRDTPTISYVQPEHPWIARQLVSSIELMFGRRKVEQIYHRLKARPLDITTFFQHALEEAKIRLEFDRNKLAAIPATGPLLFVANHPFGVVDGVVICDLVAKLRGDLRIMLHSLLCQDRELAPYFLPIDFREEREAIKTNVRSKQLALENLARGVPVIIFPSGMVSTADKAGFGKVVDSPWTTFAAKIARAAEATVVPVYFHGRNSRKFHIASHIALPLRSALLAHEAANKFGKTVRVEIGDPLAWATLSRFETRRALTDYLYGKVQELGL